VRLVKSAVESACTASTDGQRLGRPVWNLPQLTDPELFPVRSTGARDVLSRVLLDHDEIRRLRSLRGFECNGDLSTTEESEES
jgi:hypothetical protein